MKSFIILLSVLWAYADTPWIPNVHVSVETSWDTLNQGESCFAIFGDSIFSICNTAERGSVPIAPYAYSFDAGQTFTRIPFTDASTGIIWHTDPVIGVDDSGHVHMLIQFSAEFLNHYYSTDGGLTWSDTSRINSLLGTDKPWWVVNKNEIYVTWQQVSGVEGIYLSRSIDYGKTFADEKIWDRTGITAICMDENENLHLALVSWDGSVYYRKSTDKGDSWSDEQYLSNYYYESGYGDRAPINSITAHGNAVFTTWVDTRNGNWDVMGIGSTDGGTTWGTRFVVNDSTAGGQCKGWAHFDVYGGLHVTYYHTPDWPTSASSPFSFRYQYSSDSGATFRPSIRVSDTAAPSLDEFIGEYHICLSDSDYLYAIWTDGRNGDDNDLYFSKALLSELSVGEESENVSEQRDLLTVPTLWHGNVAVNIARHTSPVSVALFDVAGRMVKHLYQGVPATSVRLQLRSNDFAQGIMFVRLSTDRTTEVRKIINLRFY